MPKGHCKWKVSSLVKRGIIQESKVKVIAMTVTDAKNKNKKTSQK